jgi:hypothetical protein
VLNCVFSTDTDFAVLYRYIGTNTEYLTLGTDSNTLKTVPNTCTSTNTSTKPADGHYHPLEAKIIEENQFSHDSLI